MQSFGYLYRRTLMTVPVRRSTSCTSKSASWSGRLPLAARGRRATTCPRWLTGAVWRHHVRVALLSTDAQVTRQHHTDGLLMMSSPPASAVCRFVTAFREWFDANGGSVGWAPGVSPALPPRETRREVLLDRYENHTKHCSSCMKVRSKRSELLADVHHPCHVDCDMNPVRPLNVTMMVSAHLYRDMSCALML